MKRGLFLFFLISFFHSLRAETLEEMIPWAKKYDARYLAAQADYDMAVFRVDQARSKILPSLNTGANVTRNNLDISYDDPRYVPLNRDFNSQGVSAELIQPLFRLGDWAGLAVSEKSREASFYSFRQADSDLLLRLAQAYYDVLLAKENLNVLEAEKSALHEHWVAAEGLFKSGAVSGTAPLQIQARLSLVTAGVLEAQWGLANKRRLLETITGPDVVGPDPAEESEIEKDWGDLDDWISRESENFQIRAAVLNVEAAAREEVRAHSGFWPGVDAVGSYQNDRLGPSASVPVNTLNENASVGVRFSWSLFSGGGTLAEYRESIKRKEKAQSDLLAVQRDVDIQIAETYSGLLIGGEQLKALNQSVSASEQVTRGMEKGYQVGARTLTEVLDAREELLKAQRARNEVFYRQLVNQLKLRLLVGELGG